MLSKVNSIMTFIYKFRYLVDSEFTFYKPYYHFFGYLIRRQNPYERGEDMKKPLLQRLFSQYNVFFIFLFKTYCEWYFGARMQQIQARESAERANQRSNSLIEAPIKEQRTKYGIMVKPGHCAICKTKPMVHPCVLETSGFAFCYPCISNFIQEQGKCPITRVPSTTPQLRKIFIE